MADARALDALIGGRMIASPNYSSRRGAKVRLIVLHTTEGARSNASLGAWFGQRAAKCSSHVGIDDRDVTRFVPESYSAWTAGNANPVSTQAELCAFARWSVAEWEGHATMLELAARWVAAESIYHGIPLVRVRGAATRTGTGVAMHVDCTKGFGGTHTDCGSAFATTMLDRVIARARQIAGGQTDSTINPSEDPKMPLFSDKIRDAGPFSGTKGQDVPYGNVVQDVQANAAYAGRQTSKLPGFIDSTNQTLARLEANDRNQGDALAALTSAVQALTAAVNVGEGGDREAADVEPPK